VLQIHSPQQLFGFEILSYNSVNQIRNAAIFLLGKPFKRCSHVRLQANPDRRFFCHAKLSSFPYRQQFDNIVIYCCLAYSPGNCNPWRAEADRYRKARNRPCGLVLTDWAVIQALTRAADRGVNVRTYLRSCFALSISRDKGANRSHCRARITFP
jgi:hypothetical protein